MQDQQSKIEKSIIEAQDDLIQREAEEIGIKLDEFENVLQPIIDSCTKDSISSGNTIVVNLYFFCVYCWFNYEILV